MGNNNTTQQPNTAFATKGLEMWINIMLNVESGLDLDTIKILTVVSRPIANTLKSYIQQNYWFDLSNGRRLTYYLPTNQKNVKDVNEIMPTIKKVVFHNLFNEPVDGLLSNEITHIQFGGYFLKPVKSLPLNLTHLKFDFHFDQPVNSVVLPPKLTHLYFGVMYNQFIPSLPSKVKQVTFSQGIYNQPVWHLSKSIEFLAIKKENDKLVTCPYVYVPRSNFLAKQR
eukprot:TRINITY_DN611_c0_g1_i2.p1 TRINITY_DN611_c0_g1~~TRINITY_DN611_c0_g1_i2.p1  ORF type:complete len:226 (-),score=32.19 TRINITY_DN611_c0_g1_i2:301-978(-)